MTKNKAYSVAFPQCCALPIGSVFLRGHRCRNRQIAAAKLQILFVILLIIIKKMAKKWLEGQKRLDFPSETTKSGSRIRKTLSSHPILKATSLYFL